MNHFFDMGNMTFEPKVLDVMKVEPALSLHKVGDTEALWLVR